jgi:hypothetical protein
MAGQFIRSNRRTIILLFTLVFVLGALLILSDDGLRQHFHYSFF